MSEIKPAMDADEWALTDGGGACFQGGSPHIACYDARPGSHQSHPDVDLDDHALAALCLHEQPFGFTREDVAILRERISAIWADCVFTERDATPEDTFRSMGGELLASLADRIEALLPPEKP